MPASGENIGESSTITVRRMFASDVPSVLSILRESPEASIWSEESLLESASRGLAWTAELNGHLAGILIGRVAADEFEILNLAVGKECRRRGVATKLVGAAVESVGMEGARQSYLEVRASNEGAIALYAGMGFRVCGRRPNYYSHPTEDAVLLVLHRNRTNL
jgi:[ribosomal protein S18]-alanine N-acetyltransferase